MLKGENMDQEKALKALAFLDSRNCLKGQDKLWFERLIEDETLTLYIDSIDLCIAHLGNDEDFEYAFTVTITDIFEAILDSIGIGWEYC